MADERLAARVERMAERWAREDVFLHGFRLSVDGEILATASYGPFTEDQPHRMYSVSKTMTGLAVGMLAEDGLLRLDQRVAEFFPDWVDEGTDARILRLKLEDMLRMATCYSATAYREGVDYEWARAFFTGRPTHEGGSVFHYDTGCSQVLAALVKRLSGQEVFDLLEERLFRPLGCEDPRRWLRDPSGTCTGGTGLCMSLRDLHRVAQCLLDGGRGLVPAWYVRSMAEKHIDTPLLGNEEERWGYGWQCWRTRAGWAMYGMGGQLAVICPDKRVILTTTGDTRLDPFGVQRIYNGFFEEVYPYLGAEGMTPRSYAFPAAAVPAGVQGRAEEGTWVFEPDNPLHLKWLRLRGRGLELDNGRGPVRLEWGCGECLLTAWPGWPEVPALVSGGWLTDDTLRVRLHAIGDSPCGADLVLHFGRGLTVQARRSRDPLTEGWEGVATGIPAE